MAVERINITSPVGRFVAGSLYKPRTVDFDGKPLVFKTGPNAGQPRVDFFIALAIPKGQETHWANTEWGAKIWALGHQAHPQGAQRPDFAWKIEDGDSTIPNKKHRRPCDQEGYARHWILKLSGGYAPKVYLQANGGWVDSLEKDAIKTGYYVQVAFSVDDNKQQNNPGVYLNHQGMAFRGYGPEITFGPSVDEMGFGAAPLPAGASAVPLAATLPASGAPSVPQGAVYPPPPAQGAPYQQGGYPPPPPAAAPVQVTPNPGFVQMPPPPSANPTYAAAGSSYPPTAPPPAYATAPPVPPSNVRQMTAKAGGITYEAYRTANWSDAQLIADGLMLA